MEKKTLIGTAAKESKPDRPKSSPAKVAEPAKKADARKLAVAKLATAKLSTAKLLTLKKLGG